MCQKQHLVMPGQQHQRDAAGKLKLLLFRGIDPLGASQFSFFSLEHSSRSPVLLANFPPFLFWKL